MDVDFLVETHNQFAALADGRGAKVAGRAQHQGQKVGSGMFFFFEVDPDDFFAFGGNQDIGALEKLKRVLFLQFGFIGIILGFGVEVIFVEKLSRLFAGCSSGSEIHPVQPGHVSPYLALKTPRI